MYNSLWDAVELITLCNSTLYLVIYGVQNQVYYFIWHGISFPYRDLIPLFNWYNCHLHRGNPGNSCCSLVGGTYFRALICIIQMIICPSPRGIVSIQAKCHWASLHLKSFFCWEHSALLEADSGCLVTVVPKPDHSNNQIWCIPHNLVITVTLMFPGIMLYVMWFHECVYRLNSTVLD